MSAPASIIPQTVARPGEANAYRFGKLLDESIEEYHNCGALSKTKLDVFRDSPRLYRKRFITRELPREGGEALLIGSAVDALALEGPDAFNARFILVPDEAPKKPSSRQINAKNPSPETVEAIAFWQRFAAEAKGKEILTDKQAALVQRCADALHGNKEFARFMQFGHSQVTFRIRGDRFAMQCRPDRWLEEGCDLTDGVPAILDLKTIESLPGDEPDHLPRHIGNFGYHRAAYIYRELVATVMGYPEYHRPPFILAFVEKREPHAVLFRTMDDESIKIGEKEVGESLTRIRRCLAEDYWPESWEAPLSPVGLTGFYKKRANENTDGGLWG